jgi:hypothetical protein
MSFQVGDNVRYKDMPSQTGMVTRMHPLGVVDAMEVEMMSGGPMYPMHEMRALFGEDCQLIEKYTP